MCKGVFVMKTKTAIVLSFVIGVVLWSGGYEFSHAQSSAEQPSVKVAVVNVRKVFRRCKRNVQYRQEAVADYRQEMNEIEKLSKQIEAEEAGLKALKPGSEDHLKQYREILRKKADLEARQKYLQQQRALKDQRQTEQLYQEVLSITEEIAQNRELDMVFDKQEPEFPASSGDELMLTISTHKLLYSGGCLDITDEVISRLDDTEK